MAIQMRRGEYKDFNPSQLLPGEFAVSQDNSKIFICVKAGVVLELATVTALALLITEAENYRNESRNYYNYSRSYAVGTNGEIRNNDEIDNSKYYYLQSKEIRDYLNNVISDMIPTFQVNFETGMLEYQHTYYHVYISEISGHLLWELA